MNKRVAKLLDYLGLDYNTEVNEDGCSSNLYTVEGCEYLVLTDEEANEVYEQNIRYLMDDCGIEEFTEPTIEYIIENCMDKSWFDATMNESHQSYIETIEKQPASSDKFNNRLEEEMAKVNCNNKDDFIDYLNSQCGDSAKWYKSKFGEVDFFAAVKKYCSLDVSEICEFCIQVYGRGPSLAFYDGKELELDDDYYAYRVN